ncbi:MAG: hypothetical protein BRC29_01400 [Nanohaloarchaea archaeon SW_7_43_1]|nr:MAG: hypothetical protein BRC29_01400 [Nanohaloarchaea archaeon SW_7_43_1]
MSKGQLILNPGMALLIVLIAFLGFFVYSWSADSVTSTGNETLQEQQNVIGCTKLNIEIVEFNSEDNSTSVSFRSDREFENISVVFLGENNMTQNFDKVEPQEIETATVSGTRYSNVIIEAQGCGRVTSYR